MDYKDPQLFFLHQKNFQHFLHLIYSHFISLQFKSKPSLICLCSTKKFTIFHVKHACLIASCSRLTFIKSMVEKYDVPCNLICFTLFKNNYNVFLIIRETFLLFFFSKKNFTFLSQQVSPTIRSIGLWQQHCNFSCIILFF
jgi:hypothetical protein